MMAAWHHQAVAHCQKVLLFCIRYWEPVSVEGCQHRALYLGSSTAAACALYFDLPKLLIRYAVFEVNCVLVCLCYSDPLNFEPLDLLVSQVCFGVYQCVNLFTAFFIFCSQLLLGHVLAKNGQTTVEGSGE